MISLENKNKPFECFDHGNGKIVIEAQDEAVVPAKPIQIHVKRDGSKNNKPSFAIVMRSELGSVLIVGEITLDMLNDGLKDIGYQIIKTNDN